jgi:phosphatidylglycerophosphate synthase
MENKLGGPEPKKLRKTVIDLITDEEKKTRDNLWLTKIQLYVIPYGLRPNYVTFFRFFLVGLSIFLYFYNPVIDYIQWLIIILAAWTDLVDGSMARTRNQVTASGTMLDPIADNFLVFWIFWVLIQQHVLNYYLGWAIILMQVVIMIGAGVSILKGYFETKKEHPKENTLNILRKTVLTEISVSFIGRIHFATLVVSVVFLMFHATANREFISTILGNLALPVLFGGASLFFFTSREGFMNLGKLLVVLGIVFLTLYQLGAYSLTIGTVFLWLSLVILVFELVGYVINKELLPKVK